jgi:hypothetical protein
MPEIVDSIEHVSVLELNSSINSKFVSQQIIKNFQSYHATLIVNKKH